MLQYNFGISNSLPLVVRSCIKKLIGELGWSIDLSHYFPFQPPEGTLYLYPTDYPSGGDPFDLWSFQPHLRYHKPWIQQTIPSGRYLFTRKFSQTSKRQPAHWIHQIIPPGCCLSGRGHSNNCWLTSALIGACRPIAKTLKGCPLSPLRSRINNIASRPILYANSNGSLQLNDEVAIPIFH